MGKSLLPDPERAPLVRRAFEKYATARFTKERLLKQARAWGLTNRRGRPLTSQAIGMLLRNQLYAGIVDVPEHGVRGRRGDFEPLISEELFYRVQAILSGRVPSRAPRKRAHPDFPGERLRAMRHMRSWPNRQLVQEKEHALRLPGPTAPAHPQRQHSLSAGAVSRMRHLIRFSSTARSPARGIARGTRSPLPIATVDIERCACIRRRCEPLGEHSRWTPHLCSSGSDSCGFGGCRRNALVRPQRVNGQRLCHAKSPMISRKTGGTAEARQPPVTVRVLLNSPPSRCALRRTPSFA